MNSNSDYIASKFGVSEALFFQALKLSPNAEGYVNGSITELLLKQHLELKGFEVHRIKEKWEGTKHPNHHGDFYFRKDDDTNWFVLESKGVKSNSEKWHKLYNYGNLVNFLIKHSDKIDWIIPDLSVQRQVKEWVANKLPDFSSKYAATLYDFEEIKKYKTPKRTTPKSLAISTLKHLSREEISSLIDERLAYVMQKVKVLETHFVSGTSGSSHRTQATPRTDEFNLISIDVFLRFTGHEFLYANPKHLEVSDSDPNHLQQNYIMGFVFNDKDLSVSEEWHRNFDQAYNTLDSNDSVSEADMQVDNRN